MLHETVPPDNVLAAVVRALVDSMAVRRIVLFGSRASGKAGLDSDYDLVVVADTALPPEERMYVAHRAIRDLGVPLDILICTPDEHAKLVQWRSSAVATAEAEGKVIYEAA